MKYLPYLASITKIFFGALLLLLLTIRVDKELVGYFYIFQSILGIQLILDSGFTLTFLKRLVKLSDPDRKYNKYKIYRYSAFIECWQYLCMLCFIALILPIGLIYLSNNTIDSGVNWKLPWVISATFAGALFLLKGRYIHYEALGNIRFIVMSNLISNSFAMLLSLVLTYYNQPLWGIASYYCCSFLVLLFIKTPSLPKEDKFYRVLNKRLFIEYIKYQRKIAISYITGYFYWYSIPLIFLSFYGIIESGKYSLVNSVFSQISLFSNSQMVASSSRILRNINAGISIKADVLSRLKLTSSIYIALSVIAFIAYFYCIWLFPEFKNKFLDSANSFVVFATNLSVLIIGVMAHYCRLRENDPFYKFSLCINITVPLCALIACVAGCTMLQALLIISTATMLYIKFAFDIQERIIK